MGYILTQGLNGGSNISGKTIRKYSRNYFASKYTLFFISELIQVSFNTYLIKYQFLSEFNDVIFPGLINGDVVKKDPGYGLFIDTYNPERGLLDFFTLDSRYKEIVEFGGEMIPSLTVVIHPENKHGILA